MSTWFWCFCCNRKYPKLVRTSYFSGNFVVLLSAKKEPAEVFYKKGDIRNFTKSTENTCGFCEISKNTFLQNIFGRLPLSVCNILGLFSRLLNLALY